MEALIYGFLDVVLALALMGLAWAALASVDLLRAIVLFVAFGLTMTLVWVRLNAPDIALAEAGIGAGLTGALFLAAYAKLRTASPDANVNIADSRSRTQFACVSILLPLLGVALGYAVWTLPPAGLGVGEDVAANLDRSGVDNPVTAVLLNFRGYDTLLEVLVLLLALLGAWSLGTITPRREVPPGPVLDTLTRLMAPLLLLVAAYLLWAGAHGPGGAFQAGAVLAAAGVLMVLAGWRLPARLSALPLRLVLVVGPVTFVFFAVMSVLLEGSLLQYSSERAGQLILIIETTAAISIGATLVSLFLGAQPRKEEQQ